MKTNVWVVVIATVSSVVFSGALGAQSTDLSLLEKIRLLEMAVASDDTELPFTEDLNQILEEARLAGNLNLESRARTAGGMYQTLAFRKHRLDDPSYWSEAWRREEARRRAGVSQGFFSVVSTVSLGVFFVGLGTASGGMVLADQFWKQMITAPPGSQEHQDAYARLILADYVSLAGSFTALGAAAVLVVSELLR